MVGTLTTRDAGNHRVVVRIVEKHQRLATAHARRFQRRIHHAMERGDPVVISPAGHKIPKIDNEAAWHHGDIHPDARLVIDLQPSGLVLGLKDGEAPLIAVRASTELPRLLRDLRCRVIPHP